MDEALPLGSMQLVNGPHDGGWVVSKQDSGGFPDFIFAKAHTGSYVVKWYLTRSRRSPWCYERIDNKFVFCHERSLVR